MKRLAILALWSISVTSLWAYSPADLSAEVSQFLALQLELQDGLLAMASPSAPSFPAEAAPEIRWTAEASFGQVVYPLFVRREPQDFRLFSKTRDIYQRSYEALTFDQVALSVVLGPRVGASIDLSYLPSLNSDGRKETFSKVGGWVIWRPILQEYTTLGFAVLGGYHFLDRQAQRSFAVSYTESAQTWNWSGTLNTQAQTHSTSVGVRAEKTLLVFNFRTDLLYGWTLGDRSASLSGDALLSSERNSPFPSLLLQGACELDLGNWKVGVSAGKEFLWNTYSGSVLIRFEA